MRWTPEQADTLEQFIEQEDAAGEKPLSFNELARRAANCLPSGVVEGRSEGALCIQIHRIRGPTGGRWSDAHDQALREFICQQETAARGKWLSVQELTNRAYTTLAPTGKLGVYRRMWSIYYRIVKMRMA